jgi:hypothetical protein
LHRGAPGIAVLGRFFQKLRSRASGLDRLRFYLRREAFDGRLLGCLGLWGLSNRWLLGCVSVFDEVEKCHCFLPPDLLPKMRSPAPCSAGASRIRKPRYKCRCRNVRWARNPDRCANREEDICARAQLCEENPYHLRFLWAFESLGERGTLATRPKPKKCMNKRRSERPAPQVTAPKHKLGHASTTQAAAG